MNRVLKNLIQLLQIINSRNFKILKRQKIRQGTKNNILYIDIQANKTLDSRIISALRHKKKIADYALQDPENLFMEN